MTFQPDPPAPPPRARAPIDPWGHEHGEGERGESWVPYHPEPHQLDTGAHLLGPPVPVHRRRRTVVGWLVGVSVATGGAAALVTLS